MSNKKYELTDETKVWEGRTLHRIRALRRFHDVHPGDVGGWIETNDNLSHDGRCWVYNEAMVAANARVEGDARIRHLAKVDGTAKVFGQAVVRSEAYVTESAFVFQDAQVSGKAKLSGFAMIGGTANIGAQAEIAGDVTLIGPVFITGNARITRPEDFCWFTGVGVARSTLTVYRTSEGIELTRGCFQGTLEEFVAAVERTRGGTRFAEEYLQLVEFIKLRFEEGTLDARAKV